MDYLGEHVVVTGAANGMGRLLTMRFLELGATVAAWDFDASGLQALKDEASNDKLHVFECDLTDSKAIVATAGDVLRALDHVDIVVNNAGIVSGDYFLDLDDEMLIRTFSVNTLALFRVTRAFLPSMLERGSGHIVTIASAGGFMGTPRLTDYCSSKFAAVGFDEAFRTEMKRLGHPIHTTLVCPFFVDTGMFAGVKSRFPFLLPVLQPEYVVERIVRAIRRRRARIIMPRFVYTLFPMRLLPIPLFDRIATFFGMAGAMDSFRGRNPND